MDGGCLPCCFQLPKKFWFPVHPLQIEAMIDIISDVLLFVVTRVSC